MKQNNSMIKMMHRLVGACGNYKTSIRLSYLPGFFKGLCMKAPLIISFFLISGFINGTVTKKTCLIYGAILLGCVVLQAILHNVSDRLQSAAGFKVFADKRMQLGDHFRKLSMGYFTDGNIGKVSSVLANDMNFIEENAMTVMEELVGLMISQALMISFMFYLGWQLGVTAVVFVLLIVFVGGLTTRKSISHSIAKQEVNQNLASSVLEFAEGIGIIKTFNLLGGKSKELTKCFEDSSEKAISFEKAYAPWWATLMTVYGVGTAAILLIASLLAHQGLVSIEYLIGVILFLYDTLAGVKTYYASIARLTVTDACLDRIESVFDEAEISNDGTERLPELTTFTMDEPEISYQNVSFAYGDKEALHNISFDVDRGQMIALVGPSGGGKTTIANLLARFWDVKQGSIKIRGTDIRNVPVSDLMDNISMVFQRVYLFKDTVYNNIAMGKPDATKDDVINAAKKARAHDFIMELPDGYDTVLGEGGASLSGGERQRISIARCILKDAPIILLDEATASVDMDNEYYIQEAISELCRNKTVIVIAHRLYTVAGADQILVIKDGSIAECGSYQELISANGIFAEMVAS